MVASFRGRQRGRARSGEAAILLQEALRLVTTSDKYSQRTPDGPLELSLCVMERESPALRHR